MNLIQCIRKFFFDLGLNIKETLAIRSIHHITEGEIIDATLPRISPKNSTSSEKFNYISLSDSFGQRVKPQIKTKNKPIGVPFYNNYDGIDEKYFGLHMWSKSCDGLYAVQNVYYPIGSPI